MRVTLFGEKSTFGEKPRQLDEKFSEEIYQISKRHATFPPLYEIERNGLTKKGRYYKDQLLLVQRR